MCKVFTYAFLELIHVHPPGEGIICGCRGLHLRHLDQDVLTHLHLRRLGDILLPHVHHKAGHGPTKTMQRAVVPGATKPARVARY